MGARKELTPAQQGTILYCHKRGDSNRTIARTVGCSPPTVSKTLRRYTETGGLESRVRSGRPRHLRPNERRQLKRLVTRKKTQNRQLCTDEVQTIWRKKTRKQVSAQTIGRVLHAMGLRNCLAQKKPLVTEANKAAQLAWCQDHASWMKKDWVRVLWSDKSTFTLFQQNCCSPGVAGAQGQVGLLLHCHHCKA